MSYPLLSQFERLKDYYTGESWNRLINELEFYLSEHVNGTRGIRVGAGDSGPDVVVDRGPEAMPLAIELKVLRYAGLAKNSRNRLVELLGQSVRFRREFSGGVHLALVMVVPSSEGTDWASERESDRSPISRFLANASTLMRTNGGDSGFDRVAVGLAGHNGGWLTLNAFQAPREVAESDLAMFLVGQNDGASSPVGANAVGFPPQRGDSDAPRFLLVADEWKSRTGGISTLNRELAAALAEAGCDVHVAVPYADPDERDAALSQGVKLAVPDPIPGVGGKELLLTKPRFVDPEFSPDVIIGHGRILGPYAYAAQNLFFPDARRVHVVHTDAERLEGAKEYPGGPSRMVTAAERQRLEVELALSAHVVAGVGPLLSDSISDAMRGAAGIRPPVVEIRPGLRDWEGVVDPEDPPLRRQVLLIGRADDIHSKGVDIAVRAVVAAIARFGTNAGEPPVLVVRGVPEDEQDAVKARLEAVAAPHLHIYLRPYSSDESLLRTDLWQSRVVIMPSRHEGFGLAAYEAIAAGVPVLISSDSGLARLLSDVVSDGERVIPREVLPVYGDEDQIIDEWGNLLHQILVDPKAAFERAAEVRMQLSEHISWRDSVEHLLEALSYSARQQ